MMEFFKISYGGGCDTKVIIANNKYEAVGYYLLEVQEGTGCVDDIDDIETMSPDHEIEVSCVGFPENKTLMQIYKEKQFWDTPQVVIGLES